MPDRLVYHHERAALPDRGQVDGLSDGLAYRHARRQAGPCARLRPWAEGWRTHLLAHAQKA